MHDLPKLLRRFQTAAQKLGLEFARVAVDHGDRWALCRCTHCNGTACAGTHCKGTGRSGHVHGAAQNPGQLSSEMIVIRLYDQWSKYCRDLVITSALGAGRTAAGTPLRRADPKFLSEKVIAEAIPRRARINWGIPRECVRVATELNISNLATVRDAITAQNSPSEDLRKVRNFFAHRNWETMQKAAETGAFRDGRHPSVFDLAEYRAPARSTVDIWVDGLANVAAAAAQ